jgi:Tol biopolymer transport system component
LVAGWFENLVRKNPRRRLEIYVMKADGSEQTRLTKFRGPDIFPAWAPGGGSFAFMEVTKSMSRRPRG